jgi:hypothetical protein
MYGSEKETDDISGEEWTLILVMIANNIPRTGARSACEGSKKTPRKSEAMSIRPHNI